jgi:N-methylhydantoinase A
MPAARLAVDIGGTFTDLALERGDGLVTRKVLTTPAAPEQGVLAGIAAILAEAGLGPGDIGLLIHGTTLATNAIIERKGARTALVTTAGFRDVLAMGNESRYDQYDLNIVLPEPLVPRYLRLPVPERLDNEGRTLLPLDEAAVRALVPVLEREAVESVAVGFLHSFVNPAHEQRVRDILAAALPDLPVTLSSEVSPEMREWERFSTAAANAYVQPLMARYLRRLEAALRAMGLTAPVFLMLSGGGLATIETACRFPIRLVESGPAGGAIFSADVARRLGLDRVLSFDMGGTTAKICLIDGGKPLTARSFEVARIGRFKKGSGLPLRIPVIEMVEIGAGGGSIAALTPAGLLRVGPESAGAVPGPVCYGRGGDAPAVTDANLVLGYLSTSAVLDDGRHLDLHAARAVLARLGERLGLDEVALAAGIHRLVNARMADGVRIATVRRGVDPRRFALLSFGGAAGLHISAVAAELGIGRAVVPVHASVLSAWGMLNTDPRVQQARSFGQEHGINVSALAEAYAEMEREGRARLNWFDGPVEVMRSADIRYGEQIFEIPVPLDDIDLSNPDAADRIRQAFHRRHEALFTYALPDQDVVLVNARLDVTGRLPATAPPRHAAREAAGAAGQRRIHLGNWIDAPIWRFETLADGQEIAGPALIDSDTTTVLLRDGDRAAYDARGWLTIAVALSAAQDSAQGDRA